MMDDSKFFSRVRSDTKDQSKKEKQFLEDVSSELGNLEASPTLKAT